MIREIAIDQFRGDGKEYVVETKTQRLWNLQKLNLKFQEAQRLLSIGQENDAWKMLCSAVQMLDGHHEWQFVEDFNKNALNGNIAGTSVVERALDMCETKFARNPSCATDYKLLTDD